ncbi:Os04g0372400, partial [Oryza sativa Japonica Group]
RLVAGGWRRRREPEAGGWRPLAKEAGACRGCSGDGEATVAEAVEDGAGRRGWRPTHAEAADGDATGGCGGRRTWRRGWRPACVEAVVAAAAEARPMTAEGDVAQPATGDGYKARRIGGGEARRRW